MTCDFTGGEKRILKAAWLMEHEKSVGKAFCSFLLIFVVAYVCKRIILGRKINDIRFMLIDLKFFPALLASLLAWNCQRALGFYVRKTTQSSLNQSPWGQFGPLLPHPSPLSLSLYLRLPHTGFLWLFASLTSYNWNSSRVLRTALEPWGGSSRKEVAGWGSGNILFISPHMHPWSTIIQSVFCLQLKRNYPTPVFLPGKSHGWRSLVGCAPWGR